MPRPNRGVRLEANERGIYEIRWTEGGRSRRVSTRTTDAVAAATAFKAWKLDADREADEDSASTVRGILDRYWTEHVEPNVMGSDTAAIARRHLLIHFGDMVPAEVRPSDVRAYSRRRDHTAKPLPGDGAKIGRNAGPASVRRELVVLTAALNHAVSEARMRRGDVPSIPLPPAGEPSQDWLREHEVAALFKAAALHRPCGRMSRVERWLFLAYHTGRRTAAIEGLTWDRVDFATGMIDFDEPGRQRTKKRRGVAVMNTALRAALEQARTERDDDSLYVLDHGGRIRKALAALGQRAGVPRVHPHLLKHTCITHLLRGGVRVWDAAGAVATSAATLERVYGKHMPEAQKSAMEVLS